MRFHGQFGDGRHLGFGDGRPNISDTVELQGKGKFDVVVERAFSQNSGCCVRMRLLRSPHFQTALQSP